VFCRSNVQAFEKRSRIRKVGESKVGVLGGKLLPRVPAGCHSEDASADATGAPYVQRRVADYPDALLLNVVFQMHPNGPQGVFGNIIPVQMLVAEPAESKMLEQPIVTELKSRSLA